MKAIALALAFLALAPAARASDFVMIGQTGHLDKAVIGCPKRADFDRVKELVLQDDREAAARSATMNGCAPVKPGEPLRVEDLSVLSQATCVRARGVPICVWVPTNMVMP